MRKVHTLGVSLFGAVVAIACGGTATSDHPPGGDAGNDSSMSQNNATDGGNTSSGEDAADDQAAACVIDADLLTITPTDAAIGDSGASVGTCIACLQTTCASDYTTCNGDCMCNQGFDCIANCIGGVGNSILTCVGTCFPGGITTIEGDPAALGLFLCADKSCGTPCDTSGLGLGGGGGKKDGGGMDAASDDGSADAADGG